MRAGRKLDLIHPVNGPNTHPTDLITTLTLLVSHKDSTTLRFNSELHRREPLGRLFLKQHHLRSSKNSGAAGAMALAYIYMTQK